MERTSPCSHFTLCNWRRACQGDTGRFQLSSGFWGVVVVFFNQIPMGVIGWTVTGGSQGKGTPGIKNDKALSFARAIQGRWK